MLSGVVVAGDVQLVLETSEGLQAVLEFGGEEFGGLLDELDWMSFFVLVSTCEAELEKAARVLAEEGFLQFVQSAQGFVRGSLDFLGLLLDA